MWSLKLGKRVLNIGIKFTFELYNVPDLVTTGLTNETQDNMFVPFIDYDGTDYEIVKKDLQHLNKVFGISGFVVCKTSEKEISDRIIGHYQVFGWDKMTFQEHLDLLRHTRCDPLYKKVALVYSQRNWVLRISPKTTVTGKEHRPAPSIKEIIYYKETQDYQKSTAHLKIYEKLWDLDLSKLKTQDGIDEIEFYNYSTFSDNVEMHPGITNLIKQALSKKKGN